MATHTVSIPLRTISVANTPEHWSARHRRVREEREAVAYLWRTKTARPRLREDERAVVKLTRVAPALLDDDNLRSSMKAARDQMADELGLPNDRDPRVTWGYDQRPEPEYAVEISVAITSEAEAAAQ